MSEFTGERVVPGQVEPDLWNEHLARYAFAARLSEHKRVLDVGCGTGYGSSELARVARSVVAVDVAPEHFTGPRQQFVAARAEALPFRSQSFDLVVAFEVIEHVEAWRNVLEEARRLLAPGGQFIVSTPNRLYYAESRRRHGPNPYHVHEFEFEEFRTALAELFPSVSLYLQNHVQGIAFQPAAGGAGAAQLCVERADVTPEASHFFLAVCALTPQTGAPTWVYLPSTANLLREREQHIELLEAELRQKDAWLEQAKTKHAELVELHAAQAAELIQRTEWAESIKKDLAEANRRIVELQDELAAQHKAAMAAVEGYEAKVAQLEGELEESARIFHENEQRLQEALKAKLDELAACVELLHKAEATVEERTHWAQDLSRELEQTRDLLKAARDSRWVRLGQRFGVGPQIGGI